MKALDDMTIEEFKGYKQRKISHLEICEMKHVSTSTLELWIRENGLVGYSYKHRRPSRQKINYDAAYKMHLDGCTTRQIADRYKVHRTTAWQFIQKEKLKREGKINVTE